MLILTLDHLISERSETFFKGTSSSKNHFSMFHSRILCQSNSPIAKHSTKTPPSPRLSAQSCRFFNVKRDLLPPRSVSRDWAMPSSDQLISPPQSQAGYGSNRFRETDRVRRTQSGGASAGDFVWNFFSRFFLNFLDQHFVGWLKNRRRAGRSAG